MKNLCAFIFFVFPFLTVSFAADKEVKIGLNYPKTGPYATQGLDQKRAADLAIEEINGRGGILGHKIVLETTDSKSNMQTSQDNAKTLVKSGVKMIFGGSSSAVAMKVAKVADNAKIPFFGTLTYSNDITDKHAKKYQFRECYHSLSAARVLGSYLNKNFKGKKFFYISAKYNWGRTTEQSFRDITATNDLTKHGRALTKFPGAKKEDFLKALNRAAKLNPDVLVLVLFGGDMAQAVQLMEQVKFKKKPQLIIPNLTLGMVEMAGYDKLEGVVGALPWTWKVPYQYEYQRGKEFVEAFKAKYKRYPSTSGASAYTIIYQFKEAAERAKSFAGDKIVQALEGHSYTFLKDQQTWDKKSHQSLQTVYAVKIKSAEQIKRSELEMDYFDIIHSIPAKEAFVENK